MVSMKMYSLQYATLGWSIIPIQANDKKPVMSWKQYQGERADEATVRDWWRDDPNRNIGIVTGEISGLIVLNVDGPDGAATLETLGELPRTPVVRTGNGMHYYFRHPGGKFRNFAKKLPGLDFRGDGGYVVAPPSVHKSGSIYEWEVSPSEADLADAPVWLLELISEPKPSGAAIPVQDSYNEGPKALEALETEIARLQSTEYGQRNDQLNKSAYALGKLVGAGDLDQDHVENELWRAAREIGLEDGESKATIKSGMEAGIGDASKVASVDILPSAPPSIRRPLCLVDGHAYATTWVHLRGGKTKGAQRVIVRDDGQLFADAGISGAMPISSMGMQVDLSEIPPQNRLWSGAGVNRYLKGRRPNPADAFQQVTDA